MKNIQFQLSFFFLDLFISSVSSAKEKTLKALGLKGVQDF